MQCLQPSRCSPATMAGAVGGIAVSGRAVSAGRAGAVGDARGSLVLPWLGVATIGAPPPPPAAARSIGVRNDDERSDWQRSDWQRSDRRAELVNGVPHSSPQVSVVMPVRDGLPFLPAAITSLLRQRFDAFELLVIDDGSQDGTAAYLETCQDPRIRVFHQDRPQGVAAALNRGLHHARAPLIARMDADDVAHPDRLVEQATYLRQHPDCVIVGCQAEDIDEQGRPLGIRNFPQSDAAIRWQLAWGCPFLHPGVVFRRTAVERVGGYGEEPTTQDYALWTRLAGCGEMANLAAPLMQYRVHAGAVTLQKREQQVAISAAVASRYAATVASPPASHFHALFLFLFDGRDSGRPLGEFAETFAAYRQRFAGDADPALRQWRAHTQRRLRWHCLERIAARRQPIEALQILRLIGRFDPEAGTLSQLAFRAGKQVFSSRGPVRWKSQECTSHG